MVPPLIRKDMILQGLKIGSGYDSIMTQRSNPINGILQIPLPCTLRANSGVLCYHPQRCFVQHDRQGGSEKIEDRRRKRQFLVFLRPRLTRFVTRGVNLRLIVRFTSLFCQIDYSGDARTPDIRPCNLRSSGHQTQTDTAPSV